MAKDYEMRRSRAPINRRRKLADLATMCYAQ